MKNIIKIIAIIVVLLLSGLALVYLAFPGTLYNTGMKKIRRSYPEINQGRQPYHPVP